MAEFENITQEKYDEFKIYLVSNFNIFFKKSDDQKIQEMFEISSKNDKIYGTYYTNGVLEIKSNHKSDAFEIISKKLSELAQHDALYRNHALIEYTKNSSKFFEHVISCQICSKKLSDIWEHVFKN